jgi:hypothetical protein
VGDWAWSLWPHSPLTQLPYSSHTPTPTTTPTPTHTHTQAGELTACLAGFGEALTDYVISLAGAEEAAPAAEEPGAEAEAAAEAEAEPPAAAADDDEPMDDEAYIEKLAAEELAAEQAAALAQQRAAKKAAAEQIEADQKAKEAAAAKAWYVRCTVGALRLRSASDCLDVSTVKRTLTCNTVAHPAAFASLRLRRPGLAPAPPAPSPALPPPPLVCHPGGERGSEPYAAARVYMLTCVTMRAMLVSSLLLLPAAVRCRCRCELQGRR